MTLPYGLWVSMILGAIEDNTFIFFIVGVLKAKNGSVRNANTKY